MAELKEWQKNNIFCSYLAEDSFMYSILERIFEDLDECYSHREETLNADELRNYMQNDFIDELTHDMEDWILDDPYLNQEGEKEDG